MKIDTQLDLDVIAAQAHEHLSLLVELTAPAAAPSDARVEAGPRTVVVVLDRSGSMAGSRFDGARRALVDLVDRLDPADNFGVVAFDNHVQVVVPAGPVVRQVGGEAAHRRDPAGRQHRSVQRVPARRPGGDPGARHARCTWPRRDDPAGQRRPRQCRYHRPGTLRSVAATASGNRVTTTTVGFGLGYDEVLMAAIAAGGNGNELFAETADDAVAAIAGELDGLLSQTAQAASLLIRMTPVCRKAMVINELPATGTADGILVELGGFFAGEVRRLVFTFDIPGINTLGLAEVATLDFTWVELPGLIQRTVSVPVVVNVARADVAAGRVPDPVVRSEVDFLRSQQEKREATTRMTQGDVAGARASLASGPDAQPGGIGSSLRHPCRRTSPRICSCWVDLEAELDAGQLQRAAKLASADTSAKLRQRRRPSPHS